MAQVGLLQRLREYWPYGKSKESLPPLSSQFAVGLSIAFTIAYVLPFYLSRQTRPSSTLSRDSPSVIRARVHSVYLSCAFCASIAIYVLAFHAQLPSWEILRLLGWYPVPAAATAKAVALAALLFLGPLFERIVAEGGWRDLLSWRLLVRELSSWTGWRNYIAGPFTEELLFRSLLIPINLLTPQVLVPGSKGNHAGRVILTTPLYFGIAHMHHLYEFRLTHPHVPWKFAIAQTVMQLTYTTLFGWFAAFVFVRTGSLTAAVLVHAFCNMMGLPRVWGRVERPQQVLDVPVAMDSLATAGPGAGRRGGDDRRRTGEDTVSGFRPRSGSYVRLRSADAALARSASDVRASAGLAWTVAYYVLLVVGAVGFWKMLWPLTESASQLANI